MMGFTRLSIVIMSAATLAMGATAATAHPRHRHSTVIPPIARQNAASDSREVPNGVPGNAPFNNQLRKFSDPLGANGAK